MHCFEILFILFLVAQPTFGAAYIPGKPFRPQKYADANQVARRDCVPAAPNVSASSIIADACRQNNQTDPTTCSDEIAKSIQESGASTCNLYSNLYNACKSSNNSSLTECSDSLLGYQECSNYTLQAYAYCGCYYSLPTQLSSCANEQLQNQTGNSVAGPLGSANITQATRLVPEPITPVGPEVPPSQTPVVSPSQPALETNSTSWITLVSTIYLPIESPITGSSSSKSQDPNTANPPPSPTPIDGTRTIITTLSILEPASTAPFKKILTTTSHPTLNVFPPPPPPPPPTPTISTLTLTLLSTITYSPHEKTLIATSIHLSTYTETIVTTISYTPTPSPPSSPSPTIKYGIPPSAKLDTQTIFTTISITQTTTIVTQLINEPIATEAAYTFVNGDTTSAVAVSSSGLVTSDSGAGAGNTTAPLVGSAGCRNPTLACPMRARGVRREKRSRVLRYK